MGTDYQRIICTSAAVKCLVINVASEVDDSVVAVLDRAVFYIDQSAVFLTCCSQLVLYILVCHNSFCLLNFYACVLAQSYFRFQSYGCLVDECLTFFDLSYFDLRSGNDLFLALLCCLRIRCVDHFVCCILIENASAIHLLQHS